MCDSETISHHDFLSSLVTYMFDYAEVRSADQYINGRSSKMRFLAQFTSLVLYVYLISALLLS